MAKGAIPGSRKSLDRAMLCLGLLVAAGVAFYSSLKRELVSPSPSKLILDRRGQYLGEVPGEGDGLGYWPLPPVLPARIVQATLETEDRHFYQHPGVHLPSMLRALWQNTRNLRRVSGASTIAMQVARMQGRGSRNIFRKLKETAEAWFLVYQQGHDRVLRQYFTLAHYGNRVHGVMRASRFYFDKPLEDLSWLQAAFLASLPQSPGRMNPHQPKGLARALRRAHRILALLKSRGMLSPEDYRQALASDLGLSPRPRRSPEALHAVLALSARVAASRQTVHRATIDLDLQQQVARILSQQVAALASSGASQGAALVVDSQTGDILAYIGSRDFFDLEDRGALDYVQARRSPGSALKPFIYGLGMAQGKLTAATELPDTPMDFQMDSGRAYVPENFSHSFMGPMLAREALANSRNIPALRVLSTVGIPPVLELLELGGVQSISHEPGAYGLGLAIGNLGVTLEELVGLYAMLANGGLTLPLRRFADEPVPLPVRLLPAESAQLIAHILADPLARRPGFPAGGPLDYDYAVAVKTGTSQGFRDAWTVAFSDRLVIGVWIGNHDARRMDHLTGAGAAATAVHEMFEAIMPSRSPSRSVSSSFALPQRFLPRDVCPLSGKLAGPECTSRKVEFFAPGTEPIERCPFHHRVQIDVRNQLRAGRSCPPEFVAARAMLDLPEEYQRWARQLHLEVAPLRLSPLCAQGEDEPVAVRIREPHNRARYLWDPGTPPESSTVRFAAEVTPAEEEVVWLVDGTPVAKVGYPHEYLWPLAPGFHTVVAALAHRGRASEPITLIVAR